MERKVKKKSHFLQKLVFVGGFCIIGWIAGFLIARYIDLHGGSVFMYVPLFLGLYLILMLHIVVHEAGHLVCGLLSGYEFISFRIASFMWIKENGGVRLRRMTLAGTGGQCLMAPPQMTDGQFPVVLYNMGGALMNLLLGFLSLACCILCRHMPLWFMLFFISAVTGICYAAVNGIPSQAGLVSNDGHNALSLRKDPAAVRAFWIQLKCNQLLSQGIRLKDMPEEYFQMPEEEDMKNSITAVIGVFCCNRLMDEQRFEEAEALMKQCLDAEDYAIAEIHRCLLICDCMYCELIGKNRRDVVDGYLTKRQKKVMKSMGKFPSVLRTQYAYALLGQKDQKTAGKIKERFLKCVKSYPYPSDIQAEMELIKIAEEKEKAI